MSCTLYAKSLTYNHFPITMDTFQFTQLPSDIQDMIYKKLHVNDRIKLLTVLPKRHAIKINVSSDEKKLGVLAKAIRQGRVSELSDYMKLFLQTCNSTDPTIHEISLVFPDIMAFYTIDTPYRTINQKIMDGHVTIDDLQSAPNINNNDEITKYFKQSIYRSPLISFKVLITNTPLITWMKDNPFEVYFNLFIHSNRDILKYIYDEGGSLLQWNIKALEEQIKDLTSLYYIASCRKLVFEFVNITCDEYRKIWMSLLDKMMVDGVLEVEKRMKELGYKL